MADPGPSATSPVTPNILRLNLGINGIAWDIMGVNGLKVAQHGLTNGFATAKTAGFSVGYRPAFMNAGSSRNGAPMRRRKDHSGASIGGWKRRCQTVCKPGSVHPANGAGWPFIWDVRRRTPRATDPGGGSETRLPAEAGVPPLFGFAPGGVYHAADVAAGAVRSYRTLSPLPSRSRAVCFLWHFPWGRPRRALPGTVFPWSPDFPPPRKKHEGGHPTVWRRHSSHERENFKPRR